MYSLCLDLLSMSPRPRRLAQLVAWCRFVLADRGKSFSRWRRACRLHAFAFSRSRSIALLDRARAHCQLRLSAVREADLPMVIMPSRIAILVLSWCIAVVFLDPQIARDRFAGAASHVGVDGHSCVALPRTVDVRRRGYRARRDALNGWSLVSEYPSQAWVRSARGKYTY